MTIQTVIMNRGSLILSSDLRATIDEYKSYIGVKKIFELKKERPIGIMINGLMDFEGIPLETLIGEFKCEIDEFTTVEKIKKDFIAFLSKNTSYTTNEEYLKWVLATFKTRLCNLIEEDGFKTAINSKLTKEIPNFIKQYPHFENEFYNIIPDTLDKKHYNLKIWKIFHLN